MISSYDYVEVQGEKITADLLVWRRYKRLAPGILEAMLDANPILSKVHVFGPFLPIGLVVRIPIDTDILRGMPSTQHTVTLYG